MSGAEENAEGKRPGPGTQPEPNAADPQAAQPATEIAALDPVCKMQVLPSRARARFTFGGSTYYFCNPRCQEAFQENPQKYVQPEAESSCSCKHDASKQTGSRPDYRQAAPDLSGKLNDLRAYYLPETAFDFVCPMDPEIRQKEAGSCPKCGMALEASLKISGGEPEPAELQDLKKRLLPSAVLTIILLAISMPAMLAPQFRLPVDAGLLAFLQLGLALPVVLYGGAPIFRKAAASLSEKHLNMFSLIALGVSISFLVSLFNLFLPAPHETMPAMGRMVYFESAASIITLVLAGQILELKARAGSGRALESLFALAPSKARRERANQEPEEIPVYVVARGDRLRVLPGDKIPADGRILSGRSSLDESLLTGNALPVSRSEGETVLAGTINGDGSLLIEAVSLGRDTVFAQIVEVLASAQASRSPMQELADRVSAIFIPAVLAIAAATFLAWILSGGGAAMNHAVQNMVAVLVIACPCALGLATPIAVSTAVARASKLGLMVKDARALELLATASDILIDKTGTLTKGKFEITGIFSVPGMSEAEALQWAASLEQASRHPLAVSICEAAKSRAIALQQPQEILYSSGLGLEGVLNGRKVLVGSQKFMHEMGIATETIEIIDTSGQGAVTRVYLGIDSSLKAIIVLSDTLKVEAAEFIAQLRSLHLRPQILSGDGKTSVSGAAAILKIAEEDLSWDLMPQAKVEKIRQLQTSGRVVAMLGDGVNDAAALAAADSGIAMASGSDVALSSAPINCMHSDLLTVTRAVKLARLMTSTMKQNLFLAFAYNALALLLATGILYPLCGIELNPSIAAAAMSLSSLSVIMNSLRIAGTKI